MFKTSSQFIPYHLSTYNILDFLTNESKNIYNHYIFCHNIYSTYKQFIFQFLINRKNIRNPTEFILSQLGKFYHYHIKFKYLITSLNNFIYSFIRKHIIICNPYKIYEKIKYYPFAQQYIATKFIITKVLYSIHAFKFNKIKEQLNKHLPVDDLIYLDFYRTHNEPFKMKYIYILDVKKLYPKIKSEQNIIRRFSYSLIKND